MSIRRGYHTNESGIINAQRLVELLKFHSLKDPFSDFFRVSSKLTFFLLLIQAVRNLSLSYKEMVPNHSTNGLEGNV